MRAIFVNPLAIALVFFAPCVSLPKQGDEFDVIVEVSEWKSEVWRGYPGHSDHERKTMTFSLDSGSIRYAIKYGYCADKSHAPDVATPEGYIGMPEPRWENWYGNGFLYIIANGKDIGLTKPSAIRKLEDGERGSVQIVWDRSDIHVRLTFLIFPRDRALLAEVSVFARAELKSLLVRLVAYPAAYTTQGERCVVTPIRAITQEKREEISPQNEWWLVYLDKKFDRAKGHTVGGCGAVFLPEEVASAKVSVETYPIVTELECKAGINRFHFAVFDFYDMTNAEAEEFMKANADRVAKLLRETDFSCRHLRLEEWKKLKAVIHETLPYAKRNQKLYEAVSSLVGEIDKLYMLMDELALKGQSAPLELEDAIIANLEKLKSLVWELKFEKLFGD